MLTYAQLKKHVKHAIAGEPADELSYEVIINDAGRFLFAFHQWRFRLRPELQIDFVASQSYVDLPEDFDQLEGIYMADGLNEGFDLTTMSDLILKRSTTISSTHHWGCIVYPGQQGGSSAVRPRLELWPTPTSTTTAALRLSYLAGWPTLASDEDVASVPRYVEPLLALLVREYAKGYEEDDIGALDMRLERVMGSVIARTAMSTDGTVQPTYGELRNGAVEQTIGRERLPFDSVAAPS